MGFLIKKLVDKNKRIDAEEEVVLADVRYIGREDAIGKKQYSNKYTLTNNSDMCFYVQSKKNNQSKIGRTRVIRFEKADHKNNFYFPLFGKFDTRFIVPVVFEVVLVLGIVLQIMRILSVE